MNTFIVSSIYKYAKSHANDAMIFRIDHEISVDTIGNILVKPDVYWLTRADNGCWISPALIMRVLEVIYNMC